jgi:hypothetical protein
MRTKANVVRKMSLTDETGEFLINRRGADSSSTRCRVRRSYHFSYDQSRSAALEIICPPRHQKLQYKVAVVSGKVPSQAPRGSQLHRMRALCKPDMQCGSSCVIQSPLPSRVDWLRLGRDSCSCELKIAVHLPWRSLPGCLIAWQLGKRISQHVSQQQDMEHRRSIRT